MKYKKMLCLLLAVCIPSFLFSACSKKEAPALNISGADVTQGVYAYFLDKVVSKRTDYGLSLTAESQELMDKATEFCKEYVAVNTIFKELDLSLSVGEKAAVSTKVSEFWRIYATYYTSIGVSKQTLTKIETYNAAKDKLFMFYYDTNGAKAVKEAEITAFFSENYVAFQAINGYLEKTDEDDNPVDLTKKEIAALKSKMDSLAVRLADGESFEDVSDRFALEQGSSTGNTGVVVVKKNDIAYPAGFCDAVAKLKTGKPKVILLDKYIFLIVRADTSNSDADSYQLYRTDCLKGLKGDEMDAEIASIAASYSAEKNVKIINNIYDKIVSEDES